MFGFSSAIQGVIVVGSVIIGLSSGFGAARCCAAAPKASPSAKKGGMPMQQTLQKASLAFFGWTAWLLAKAGSFLCWPWSVIILLEGTARALP